MERKRFFSLLSYSTANCMAVTFFLSLLSRKNTNSISKYVKQKTKHKKRLLITLRRIKEKKDQRLGIVGEKNLGRLGGYRKGERHTRKRNTKLFLADCLASRAASGIFLGEITPLVAAKVLDGNFRVFLYAIKKKRMEPHEIEITSVNRTETRGKKERKKHF